MNGHSAYIKVAKFGGSSLADASGFREAAAIIRSDPARSCVVVSAPGKRCPHDMKITDMLIRSLYSADGGQIIDDVMRRYSDIILTLGLRLCIDNDIPDMKAAIELGRRDFLLSRGEYLSARIMAELLGYEFVDPCRCIRFDASGACDLESSRRLAAALLGGRRTVIPGFYGADGNGSIRTFTRGGSDITGAIAASALSAALYEKWTDVSGIFPSDPRLSPGTEPLFTVTYDELGELARGGAEIMHADALLPVRLSGIPICVKNTRRPQDPGTLVTAARSDEVYAPDKAYAL